MAELADFDPPDLGCQLPPPGWWCSREPGHDGPCAAREVKPDVRYDQFGRIHPREWAMWPWQQCRARREPGHPDGRWGRCELRRGHAGDHALEFGMSDLRWSTAATG